MSCRADVLPDLLSVWLFVAIELLVPPGAAPHKRFITKKYSTKHKRPYFFVLKCKYQLLFNEFGEKIISVNIHWTLLWLVFPSVFRVFSLNRLETTREDFSSRFKIRHPSVFKAVVMTNERLLFWPFPVLMVLPVLHSDSFTTGQMSQLSGGPQQIWVWNRWSTPGLQGGGHEICRAVRRLWIFTVLQAHYRLYYLTCVRGNVYIPLKCSFFLRSWFSLDQIWYNFYTFQNF